MRGIVSWFAENHVAANLLMVFLILAGVVTGLTMKVEIFPETSMDMISITVEYPGASPSEVEEAVITKIEDKVAGLAGIKRIESTAREGFATVTIEVMKGWDLQELLDDVNSEVDRITTLPEEAERPIVSEVTRKHQVINVAVYGDTSESTIKHLAEEVKDDITNLPGITLAELFGVREEEVHIEIPEQTLRRYHLTLGQVAAAVRKASLDLPAGSVETKTAEILIRAKGQRYYADEYRDVAVITRPDGSKVTLGDIAILKDGFEDVDLITRFQGKRAAVIQVFRVAEQNALSVASTVKKYIEEKGESLPEGVGIAFYEDMSKILKDRLELLLKNMGLGLILVSIVLAVFLDLRLAFWVTLGIPISFFAGLMVLPQFDVSINMISLFAFIMVLGIVVDDAIIIGENVFRKNEEGMSPLKAAVEGTLEVGRPVVFAVLTTVAAFWPLLLGSGFIGKVMRALPIVVIVVLLGSLVEALMILPCHLERSRSRALARSRGPRREKRMSLWLKSFIKGPYARAVDLCVRWRYATLSVGIALLLITFGLWKADWIGYNFFPKVESDILVASVTMPTGTPVKSTEKVVARLEKTGRQSLLEMDKKRPESAPPLFEKSVSVVGMHLPGHGPGSKAERGSHLGQVYLQILEGEKREMKAADLANLWRDRTGAIPDAESITFQSEIFSAGSPIEIHLSLDNYDRLVAASEELKAEIGTYPGVFDIADSFLPGKDEVQFKLEAMARSLGLTLNDLAWQVRHAFYGAEALRFQRGEDEVKVKVRYPERQRESLDSIQDMRIHTPEGFEVPFTQVAKAEVKQGYSTIQRAQRRRVIKVMADVDESVADANEIRKELRSGFLPQLKNRYPGLRYTIEGEGKEQKEAMSDVLKGFVIALFAIYALLAIPFRSFTQPLVVMGAIPFGAVGAMGGHLLMGLDLSILSIFGMVGLAGVVVNDSLILIHAANHLRGEKGGAHDAITTAGQLRLRAIILTSLTTFAGLTPMIMETSLQAQFLIPMAVSLGFGVLFGTLVTLLLVPSGYMILEDIHLALGRVKELKKG